MIWHLALPEDWLAQAPTGSYRVSTRGMSLDEVGFIHCSRSNQIEGVAQLFYSDLDELLMLEIDEAAIESSIIDEPPAPGVDEMFPHIYGPIPTTAVVNVRQWRRTSGVWELPDQGPENTPVLSPSR